MTFAVRNYQDGACLRCGAMVAFEDIHDRVHDGMCGHRDPGTGLVCMKRVPCDGKPHCTETSRHTWGHLPDFALGA